METFKKHAPVVAPLLCLALVGIFMGSHQADAQNGPPNTLPKPASPVDIVNSIPLPITGTVSGTVAATQSGVWSVGLTNGTASTPLFVKNVDDPALSPYQETTQVGAGNSFCNAIVCGTRWTFSPVPSDKRLVIKEMAVRIRVNTGGAVSAAVLSTTATGLLSLEVPMAFQDAISFSTWVTNQQVNFYVDAGVSPAVSVQTDSAHTQVSLAANATLTGYFVSLP